MSNTRHIKTIKPDICLMSNVGSILGKGVHTGGGGGCGQN